MSSAARVVAVCVAYQPDMERLTALIRATNPQVDRLLLIDNSENSNDVLGALARAEAVEHRWLGGNRGLAQGFNAGIDEAIETRCTHVLLLDQDSIPAPDMVRCLLDGQTSAEKCGAPPIAAMGPCYQDARLGPTRHVRFDRFPPERVNVKEQAEIFPVDMMISSGSLIPLEAFNRVGKMESSLFIDHIDTEWCLRAKHAGCILLAVQTASMEHLLGDRSARLFRHELPVHNPERLFYVFRNSLLLYRRAYAPWQWIASDLRRLVIVFILHVVHGKPRWRAFTNMFKGILAGIRG